MSDLREETARLLADTPATPDDLRELLHVDERETAWTFADVSLNSGVFGELVARGVVESTGDGYRLADRDAVVAVLDGDDAVDDADARDWSVGRLAAGRDWLSVSRPTVDRNAALAVGAALALVFAFCVLHVRSVFVGGDVVLLGNDPYFYRYWLLQLARGEASGLVPEAFTSGEPLTVAVLWLVASVFGGGERAIDYTLAWYPVAAGLATAAVTYLLAARVGDRRVGLAAVALLAVTPVHAYRTGLGFADHHPFDYVWLSVTALALGTIAVRTVRGRRLDRATAAWTVVLGVSVAAQTLAWTAGPLLLTPLGLYAAARAVLDVKANRSPLRFGLPATVGVGLGALLVWLVHATLGWQPVEVALSPLLLFVGVAGVVGIATALQRARRSHRAVAGTIAVGGLAAAATTGVLLPEYAAEFGQEVRQLVLKQGTSTIVEAQSLFAEPVGSIFGPIYFFGFLLGIALPYLAWLTWAAGRRDRVGWLVPTTYTWVFLGLTLAQVRFAGELAPFLAVVGALGFVHLASLDGITERPAVFAADGQPPGSDADRYALTFALPNRRTLAAYVALFVLFAGISVPLVPARTASLTYSDDAHQAAAWMEGYAEDQGWTYPENYVFSGWSHSRMYNAFVSGESKSYGYARANYDAFGASTDGERWYQRLRDRAGFVVTEDRTSDPSARRTLYDQLHDEYGSDTSHYRASYASDDGSVKVFTLVPGARVVGTGPANETITVETDVAVPNAEFSYQRRVQTTMNGWYATTVPYPGTYTGGDGSVTVTESNVQTGGFTGPTTGNATWSFDEGRGTYVFDSSGGHHGILQDGRWVEGVNGRALSFNGDGYVEIPNSSSLNGTDGFTLSVWFRTAENVDYRNTVKVPRIAAKAPSSRFRNTSGYQLSMIKGKVIGTVGNGSDSATLRGPRVDDGKWHHAVLTWDGTDTRLFVDGTKVENGRFTGIPPGDSPVVIGASSTKENRFPGTVDTIRIIDHPVTSATIADWYNETSTGE